MLPTRPRTQSHHAGAACSRGQRSRWESENNLCGQECGVLLGGFMAASLLVSSHAQDTAPQVDSSLFGQEMASESSGFGLDPIGDDGAGYSGTTAEELTEASEESLKKRMLPEALLLKVALGAIYDDNLFLDETDKAEDTVMQARLGVVVRPPDPGNATFSFNYEGVGFYYLENDDFNDFNHELGVSAGLALPKTQLGFSANYQRVSAGDQSGLRRLNSTSTPLNTDSSTADTAGAANQQSQNADREAGSFSVRDVIAASLSASRSLAPKTSLTSSLNYSGTLYQDDTFQDSQDYSARLGLSYEFSGKTTLGLAGTYGKLDNGLNSSQTYQNILLTASYNASGKLVFRGEAGVEFRQYGRREPIEVVTVTIPAPAPMVAPVKAPVVEATQPPAVTPTLPSGNTSLVAPSSAADPSSVSPDPTVTSPVASEPVAPGPAAESNAAETSGTAPATSPAPVIDYTTAELPEEEDSQRFVFNLQAAYQVRVRTSLRLGASKGTGGAATLGSPSVQRTTFSLGMDQGIGRRVALILEGGYQLEDYGSTAVPTNVTTGQDQSLDSKQFYMFGRATLNYMPRPNTSFGVFYEFRSNDGGDTGLTYQANRIGVQAAISF